MHLNEERLEIGSRQEETEKETKKSHETKEERKELEKDTQREKLKDIDRLCHEQFGGKRKKTAVTEADCQKEEMKPEERNNAEKTKNVIKMYN